MNLNDLTLPPKSPLTEQANDERDEMAQQVYRAMERCARLLALYFLTHRAGEGGDLEARHAFRTELTRTEFAHMHLTKARYGKREMIRPHDRDAIRRRALAITHATRTAMQETAQ